MESLKEKTAKGLFWGGMNNGVQQLLGLVFGIILGRLLNPSDYGLIAMITIFSLIATALQNSGFSTALVNEKEPMCLSKRESLIGFLRINLLFLFAWP